MASTETNDTDVPPAAFLWDEEAHALHDLTPDRRMLSVDAKNSGSQEWR
jgi:hypothetical protein